MVDVHDTGYLSIGEVLGLLLEEFPDVTISKIRFLESQGLISPERTSSGYRKFYTADVDLLRVILTEQRTNYLPLRVIKNRLATGEIDPSGEHLRPNGDEHARRSRRCRSRRSRRSTCRPNPITPARCPLRASALIRQLDIRRRRPTRPTNRRASRSVRVEQSDDAEPADVDSLASAHELSSVLLDRGELCGMTGMTDDELTQLEGFGILTANKSTGTSLYGGDAVEIAKTACQFLRAGVDARHLRNWRTSAEREASLYEQLVTPKFRQRNPEARAAALSELARLDQLGAKLRAAMTRQALRHHFEA